jgi:hypothetical protein
VCRICFTNSDAVFGVRYLFFVCFIYTYIATFFLENLIVPFLVKKIPCLWNPKYSASHSFAMLDLLYKTVISYQCY